MKKEYTKVLTGMNYTIEFNEDVSLLSWFSPGGYELTNHTTGETICFDFEDYAGYRTGKSELCVEQTNYDEGVSSGKTISFDMMKNLDFTEFYVDCNRESVPAFVVTEMKLLFSDEKSTETYILSEDQLEKINNLLGQNK